MYKIQIHVSAPVPGPSDDSAIKSSPQDSKESTRTVVVTIGGVRGGRDRVIDRVAAGAMFAAWICLAMGFFWGLLVAWSSLKFKGCP